jgi:hypothetical protein
MTAIRKLFAPTWSTMVMIAVAVLLAGSIAGTSGTGPRAEFVNMRNDYPARANAIVHRLKDELDSILKAKGVTGTFFVDIEVKIRLMPAGGYHVAIGWQVADKAGKLIGIIYQDNNLPVIPGPEDDTWRQAAAGGAYGVMKLLAGEEREI